MHAFRSVPKLLPWVFVATALSLAGCEDDGNGHMHPFLLQFVAVDGATEVGCGDVIGGLGPDEDVSVEISDLRFYVSNIRVYDGGGNQANFELDENEFQFEDEHGAVSLIDLTGTSVGSCAGSGSTAAEGTARTNDRISGQVSTHEVARVSFDVGIPQHLMKHVLANHTAEGAPSPLAEMHWSWAYAYRYLVMNFTIEYADSAGEGFLHVGSNDCGGDGTKALTDRDECGKMNAPRVSLTINPESEKVALDVRALLAGLDMLVDNSGNMVPGCACHSSSEQPDCAIVFSNLGINQSTGTSSAGLNTVFKVQ